MFGAGTLLVLGSSKQCAFGRPRAPSALASPAAVSATLAVGGGTVKQGSFTYPWGKSTAASSYVRSAITGLAEHEHNVPKHQGITHAADALFLQTRGTNIEPRHVAHLVVDCPDISPAFVSVFLYAVGCLHISPGCFVE